MDGFGTLVVRAMGHLHDAGMYANCGALPVASLTFDNREDRYRFECSLKHGLDPSVGVAATEGREDHEYQLNGIILKLLVKETT